MAEMHTNLHMLQEEIANISNAKQSRDKTDGQDYSISVSEASLLQQEGPLITQWLHKNEVILLGSDSATVIAVYKSAQPTVQCPDQFLYSIRLHCNNAVQMYIPVRGVKQINRITYN
eukprot:2712005-Ditylum_brightwellii.AAC.1